MAAPDDSTTAPPGLEFVPLARAAALAHERLFPGQATKDSKILDLLALALSAALPLYQRDMESGVLRELAPAEIAAGRFTRGATTLEFAGRPPLRFLVVSRRELDAAIRKLLADSLVAPRMSAVLRQRPAGAPRP